MPAPGDSGDLFGDLHIFPGKGEALFPGQRLREGKPDITQEQAFIVLALRSGRGEARPGGSNTTLRLAAELKPLTAADGPIRRVVAPAGPRPDGCVDLWIEGPNRRGAYPRFCFGNTRTCGHEFRTAPSGKLYRLLKCDLVGRWSLLLRACGRSHDRRAQQEADQPPVRHPNLPVLAPLTIESTRSEPTRSEVQFRERGG